MATPIVTSSVSSKNQAKNLTVTQAIKAALKTCKVESTSQLSHSQLLDSVAKSLGFGSFRALLAAEKASGLQCGPEHALLEAYKRFELIHPGFKLELSVRFNDPDGAIQTSFGFALNSRSLKKLVALEGVAFDSDEAISTKVGSLEEEDFDADVSVSVFRDDDESLVRFEAVCFDEYVEVESDTFGHLRFSSLIEALNGCLEYKFSSIGVGEYVAINDSCMALKVAESTIRISCEFSDIEDYYDYPSADCDHVHSGSVRGADGGIEFEGFLAAVLVNGWLVEEHQSN